MQQRQLRLGDILDDYCPRERRITNHAVVAMIGEDVKQTRCTTCDAEHVYKQAKIPRQRRKDEAPAALYAQVAAGAPKRVAPAHHGSAVDPNPAQEEAVLPDFDEPAEEPVAASSSAPAPLIEEEPDVNEEPTEGLDDTDEREDEDAGNDGPVHRPLIRASLPRPDGQQPPARPIPEFTIRQPGGGRPNRFRPRHRGQGGGRGPQGAQGGQGQHGHQFGNYGNRGNGNFGGPMRGPRPNAGRPGGKRHGPQGRKRSK
ncbi:MAG TPA: hypothetical protein VH497_02925 [Vicinamibacterales bacterium]|jgi:hypothetical protein